MNEMYYVDGMYLPHVFSLPQGLVKSARNPYRCGAYFAGDGRSAAGYFFAYSYEEYFTVSICDFHAKRTCRLWMPPLRYVAFRGNLDADGRIRHPKLYFEENARETEAVLCAASPVRYVEVEFYPAYYERLLPGGGGACAAGPFGLWQSVPGDAPWPHEVVQVLLDIQACAYTGHAAELYFIGKCNELMAHILQADFLRTPIGDPADVAGIAEVVSYLDECFCENIRQPVLTQVAKMSATKLKDLFKRITGSTITGYILEKRMQKAMRLLASADLSIAEVASAVGYETATGFAASFKKRTGLPPAVYRKNVEVERIDNPSRLTDIVF